MRDVPWFDASTDQPDELAEVDISCNSAVSTRLGCNNDNFMLKYLEEVKGGFKHWGLKHNSPD